MAQKTYTIGFYTLAIPASANSPTLQQLFDAFIQNPPPHVPRTNGDEYEIRNLTRTRGARPAYYGEVARIRKTGLPHQGRAGGIEMPLALDPAHGLIEKNFFRWTPHRNLLLWQHNYNGSGAGLFRDLLKKITGLNVVLAHVVSREGIHRLMARGVELRALDLSIARPTNEDLYRGIPLTGELIDIFNVAGGDRISVSVRADGRARHPTNLTSRVKNALRHIVQQPAVKSAKVEIVEGDLIHPVDLVADRVTSEQTVELEGRYATATGMHAAFGRALREKQDDLDQYFGTGDAVIA